MDQLFDQTEESWPSLVAEPEDDAADDGQAPAGLPAKRFLDASEILAIPDIETRDVWVPEWGTYVRVRALSAIERDAIIDSNRVGKGRKERLTIQGLEAKFVAAAAQKPDGTPLFTRDQVHQLAKKNAGAISRIYQAIAEMSGLGDDAEEKARGNSSPTRNGVSPSG